MRRQEEVPAVFFVMLRRLGFALFSMENMKYYTGIAAGVAELVDAQDLGSCGVTRGGSSPSTRTSLALF